ncbi:glyoxylate/hydroxypyruvate reductase A [Rosenbergiella australiborealis]|uniref:Glyoxylate/hydroxypyruvate reductase A n=1 Tax=Rosenbergiella australiborealis TaxID=1544696 RepID=A0ABS5T2U5_9GAMM|nr:glyoxylate/hydroxypyruvate reductase A [Rosenbergiella australiborealis]MBT0726683.1 glyoxylate/hydroxypyruvate reductase A [Rosenbergiella australiborealis]
MSIVYWSSRQRGDIWQAWLAANAPDLPFYQWPETGDPCEVRYLVTWEIPEDLHKRFPNLAVIFSVGAGADQFMTAQIPDGVTVVRMIEPGLVDDMAAYITFSVVSLHRGIPRYLRQQQQQVWQKQDVPPASRCRVGLLGLGNLGQASARVLMSLGYSCSGWSRTPKSIAGMTSYVGDNQLAEFLKACDILVCLLPLTDRTRGILNRQLFDQLPHGAGLVHAGRGQHLDHQALIDALESGKISHAVVDVTDPEPLPEGHPFWTQANLWLTPHIASETHAESSVSVLLDNIRRHQQGKAMNGVVDLNRGY